MAIDLSFGRIRETDCATFEVKVDGRAFRNRMPVIGTTAVCRVPDKDMAKILVRGAQKIIKFCRLTVPEVNRVSIQIEDGRGEAITLMADDWQG